MLRRLCLVMVALLLLLTLAPTAGARSLMGGCIIIGEPIEGTVYGTGVAVEDCGPTTMTVRVSPAGVMVGGCVSGVACIMLHVENHLLP